MNDNKLTLLHDMIADGLIERIRSGEASSSDYSNAIRFLKDNGVNCDSTKLPLLNDLIESLPDINDLEEMFK